MYFGSPASDAVWVCYMSDWAGRLSLSWAGLAWSALKVVSRFFFSGFKGKPLVPKTSG